MTRTRVKICGITRIEDGLAAAAAGVDALGLVFYPKSSRLVDVGKAAEIAACLPAFVTTVGLFLDASESEVTEVLKRVPLDLLQFHGNENVEYCESFGRPYIKAVPMRYQIDVEAYASSFQSAKALLLDSHGGGRIGGSGERFDWQQIPDLQKPIILAGGLYPENVHEAIEQVQCYGLDVSSGVEAAKGIKDKQLVLHFMQQVREADYKRAV